jgi:hypothetical protein
MRRREFISFAGGVALAWSLGARAQEPGRVYRIAIVVPVGRDEAPNLALIDELRRLGFVEGENLLIVPGGFLTTNEQSVSEGDTVHTTACHDRGYGWRRICSLAGPARRQYYRHQPDVA